MMVLYIFVVMIMLLTFAVALYRYTAKNQLLKSKGKSKGSLSEVFLDLSDKGMLFHDFIY